MRQMHYNPRHTYWQYVFPLDAVEYRHVPDGNGGFSVVEQTFDREYLQGLVDNYGERMRISGAAGMPPQPAPISRLHVIEATLFGEEHAPLPFDALSTRDMERLGGVLDLYLHAPADGADAGLAAYGHTQAPFGLWALCEWTFDGLWTVECGGLPMLSPTTGPYKPTSSPEPMPGDSLLAIAAVDVPALDQIGCAIDRLPHSAFASLWSPAPEYSEDGEVYMVSMMGPYRASVAAPGMVMRRKGSYSLGAVVARADNPPAPNEGQVDESEMKDLIAALLERIEALEAAMTEPELGTEDGDSNTSAMADPVVDDIEARAAAAETQALNTEALGLVDQRRLLAANVRQYITARRSGDVDAAAACLGEYGAPVPAGTGIEPVTQRPEAQGAQSVSESDLLARALVNVNGNKRLQHAEFRRLKAEAVRNNITIERG